jgi:hypothetical protein
MKGHVTVKGRDGTFTACIAWPEELPAPAIVERPADSAVRIGRCLLLALVNRAVEQ